MVLGGTCTWDIDAGGRGRVSDFKKPQKKGAIEFSINFYCFILLDGFRLKRLIMTPCFLAWVCQGDERSESRRFILDPFTLKSNPVNRGATMTQ